ncbi:MAG: hypothetical protein ABF904_11770 [Ethanoligenens sp.]
MAALYDFLNRRDTWANWQNNNVVLPEGVLGVITDSPADELWLLMGDGQTHVKDLKTWKLYQDTVRSSKPATLSQLTIKSDGTNAPFTILDTNLKVLYVVNPNGLTEANDSDGKTLLQYGPGAPFIAVSDGNTLTVYPGDGPLDYRRSDWTGFQAGNTWFNINFTDNAGFQLGKSTDSMWFSMRTSNYQDGSFGVYLGNDGYLYYGNNQSNTQLSLNTGSMYYRGATTYMGLNQDGSININGQNLNISAPTEITAPLTVDAPVNARGGTVSGIGFINTLSGRPTTGLSVGLQCFDTDLGKPIWCKAVDANGNATWVDGTGAVV